MSANDNFASIAPPPDIAAWRKQMRETLRARRAALAPVTLARYQELIDRHIERGFPNLAHGVVAFCWPYDNEYDARGLAERLRAAGAVTALPVVVAPRTPLVFRAWEPGIRLARGTLGIPYPAEDTPALSPATVLLPMVGFDDGGFRLGYGGGFFDRTLAALPSQPLVIGIAYELARLPSIHPQAWDIPTAFIVTERGVYERRENHLDFLGAPGSAVGSITASPPCYATDLD